LRGDISAEVGATTVTVTGIQQIPVVSPPVEPNDGDTFFYSAYNNEWYYSSPWKIPDGQDLTFEGPYGYSPVGLSWLASDTLAVGDGTPGDVSGAMAMTGLILFGAATYEAPYGYDYDPDYGSPYDQYYTTLYSGATQNWSMILPSGPGANGQFLKTDGTGRTSWATVSSGSSAWSALTGAMTYTQVAPWYNATSTVDSGISRLGAASLAIGNGTAGDFTGTLKLTEVLLADGSSFSPASAYANAGAQYTSIKTNYGGLYLGGADNDPSYGLEVTSAYIEGSNATTNIFGYNTIGFSFTVVSYADLVTTAVMNSNGAFLWANNFVLGWTAVSNFFGQVSIVSLDTALSRISAGLIGVGTGAQGSFAGSLKLTTLTAVGGVSSGSVGTAGVLTLVGSTSGSATFTAPAVAGTVTNPVLSSNSLELATGTVLSINAVAGLSGISSLGAASLAIGNGTAGDTSGQVTAKTYMLSDFGSVPTSTSGGGTAGTVGQLVQHSGVLYFCSVTGVAGSATWNVITMTLSA
jgi:hypothetical protein